MAARRTSSRGRTGRPAGKAGPRRRVRRGEGRFAWLGTLAVGVVLIVGGFASGVVLGVVTEEPTVLTEAWSQGAERVALREARTEPERAPEPAVPAPPATAADPQVAAVTPAEPAPARSAPPAAEARAADGLPSVSAPPAGFAVQVAAFGSSDAARAMRGKLEAAGYDSFVSAGAASRDRRWRVRVGPFPTRAGAERAAARLEQRDGLATWIVALENEG